MMTSSLWWSRGDPLRRHQVVDGESLRELSGEDGRETVNRFAHAADVRARWRSCPTTSESSWR